MQWLLLKRFLSQRVTQTVMVLLALGLGSALITSMSAVYFDVESKMSQEVRTFGANFFVGSGAQQSLDQHTYDQIIEDIPAALHVASSPYLYHVLPTSLGEMVVLGVRFSGLQNLVPYWQVEGRWISVDFDDRHAMIGRSLAQKHDLHVGDTLVLTGVDREHQLKIRGIIESGDEIEHNLVINLDLARVLFGTPTQLHYGLLSIQNSTHQVQDLTEQEQAIYPDLDIHPILQISHSEGALLHKLKGLMGLVAVFILLLSTLCVNTTLTAMITERRKEFALQKALGAGAKDLMQQLILETSVLGFMASLIGLSLGYVMAQVLGQAVFHAHIDFCLQVLPITIGVSYFAAFVAVLIPMRRSIRVEAAHVLKGE